MSTTLSITDHYNRVQPVYDELGTLGDVGLFPANGDKTHWYMTKDAGGEAVGSGRPATLAADAGDLHIDRTVYVTINTAARDWYLDSWTPYIYTDDNDRAWQTEQGWDDGTNPMPDYADLTALAPFADIDVTDVLKLRRADGHVPRDVVEQSLEHYISGFAALCGGRGPVHALDSVGGAYVMVSPSVTAPLADRYTGRDRARVFEALADRLNNYATRIKDAASHCVPDHDAVMDPDLVCHKNRLHKAPLALHGDLDGVVTPIDTETPQYDYTPVTEVDDALITDAVEWASSYTDDYSDRVGHLVSALWDGAPADWETTLDEWIDEATTATNTQPSPVPNPSDEHRGNVSTKSDALDDDRTAPIEEVYAELDRLSARDVAEDTIVDTWNSSATSGKGDGFTPTWASGSCGGTANYVNDQIWHDTGADAGRGHHGTVIELALIGSTDVSWRRGDIADGDDWVQGIRELRKLGYDIPLPQGDVDDDVSRYYTLDLTGIASDHNLSGDPYEDDLTLLRACLWARAEVSDLSDEDPPYAALRAVAMEMNLTLEDDEEGIIGKSSYKVARRIFDDLEAGDI
jgi:putative DNA primase/helicase